MKKYILMGILAITMLFSSCSLDTSPTNSVGVDVALSNVANMNMTLKGVYRFNLHEYWDNHQESYGLPMFNITNDIFGGTIVRDYVNYYSPMYDFSDAVTGSRESQAPLTQWMLPYGAIRRLNAMIEGMGSMSVPEGDIDAKNRLVGEIYTMRAYMHFILNVKFATRYPENEASAKEIMSVPLRVNTSLDPIPRSTQYDVIQHVLSDIETAIAAFKLIDDAVVVPEFHTITSARVLKARVQMYMHDYAGALATAEEIMADSRGARIMTAADYKSGFNLATNPEYILAALYTNKRVHHKWSFYAYMGQNYISGFDKPMLMDLSYLLGIDGDKDLMPEEKAYDGGLPVTKGVTMRAGHDSRADLVIYDTAEEIKANIATDPAYYTSKGFTFAEPGMSNKYRQTVDYSSTGLGDIVYMRLAEVYYIAAEAAAMMNNDSKAQTYLTATASPYDAGAAAFIAGVTGDNLKTLIANYKAVDMWGEGRRLEDVKRRGEWVYRIEKYSKNASRSNTRQYKSVAPYLPSQAASSVQFDDIMTYAIPQKEMNNNEKVTQQGNGN